LALHDLGGGLAALVGLVAVTGLLAGAYPAVALSRFRPHAVLKGRFVARAEGAWLRRGLVVVQLSLTIALIAGTAVVYSQLDYMQNRNLGFDPGSPETGHLLALDFGGDAAVQERLDAIKQRLAQHPGVLGVASSLTVPTGGHPSAGGAVEAPNGQWRDFSVEAYLVDTSFVDVYDMTLVAGVRPGAATTSDSLVAYVFNETAVRAAGYGSPRDILGKQAGFWGTPGEVVGVVQDFHVQGLQHPVQPLALAALPTYHNYLTLRVRTEQLPGTLADLRQIWSEMAPQRPFAVRFLDDAFGAQYAAERRFGTLFGVFAGLAIVIACLGLLGLVAFAAQQRTKEIGVRKVLGASTTSVVALLTKEVVQLAGVAFVVAAPAIYWAMEQWLSRFAYRAEIGWGVVLASGLLALVVAASTAGVRAWHAARIDPTRALRTE
jgi:putative ABC transport system permease protein